MSILVYCLLYWAAGFLQEVLITSYHRCVMAEKNLLASFLTSLITIVSIGVVAGIIKKILDPTVGLLSLFYILIFAAGKGSGAYLSLTWWTKKIPGLLAKKTCGRMGSCQRKS